MGDTHRHHNTIIIQEQDHSDLFLALIEQRQKKLIFSMEEAQIINCHISVLDQNSKFL